MKMSLAGSPLGKSVLNEEVVAKKNSVPTKLSSAGDATDRCGTNTTESSNSIEMMLMAKEDLNLYMGLSFL
jgi:hypothetical protein